jgi:hypothetical protein
MIRHGSGSCVELSATNNEDIYMAKCDPLNKHQRWSWKKREENVSTTD